MNYIGLFEGLRLVYEGQQVDDELVRMKGDWSMRFF